MKQRRKHGTTTHAVLHFIEEYQAREARPPTMREISEHFKLRSPRAAGYHIEMLVKGGCIERRDGARNVKLIGTPKERAAKFPTPKVEANEHEQSQQEN